MGTGFPADKHGTSLESISEEGGLIQAAEDGSGLAYIAKGPVQSDVEGNRSISHSQLLAKRGSSGWETRDITTPHENPAGIQLGRLAEYTFFNGDLSSGFVEPQGATRLASQATEPTPYLRESVSGSYVPLVYPGNVPLGTKWGGEEDPSKSESFSLGVTFVTATADGKHAILESKVPLTEGLAIENSVYESTGGELTLVSEVPPSPATACGGTGPACEAAVGHVNLGTDNEQVRGVLSDDGNRVTFSQGNSPYEASLFVRDLARGETVQVDAPQGGTGRSGYARFQLASSDGHRVFFTDSERLTENATAQESKPDLYMCTVEVVGGHLSCALKDLTVDPNPGEAAAVQGAVIGADTTGRLVYFAANGALAAGAAHGGCGLVESTAIANPGVLCNLYVYDVASEKVSLIGVASERDGNDWAIYNHQHDLGALTARVSPNGQWFAFMSRRLLTGFDNRDAHTGEPDEEVFLYNASAGTLRCVSCAATGARPLGVFDEAVFPGLLVDQPGLWGDESKQLGQGLAGSLPGWTRIRKQQALYQSRYLSDEGRLFFNSPVGLVPAASNGKEDVYEFEPAGPNCDQPTGCVALISSGRSDQESAFLDASASGEDVFFLTAAKLVGADTDNALDVYDAHVCTTAVPCPSGVVSVPPACSTADSCRAAPAAQPAIFGAPASATFTGAGNVTPPGREPAVKLLTRAQKLAKALKACRSRHNKHKRAVCEKQARHAYGPLHKARKAAVNRSVSR